MSRLNKYVEHFRAQTLKAGELKSRVERLLVLKRVERMVDGIVRRRMRELAEGMWDGIGSVTNRCAPIQVPFPTCGVCGAVEHGVGPCGIKSSVDSLKGGAA